MGRAKREAKKSSEVLFFDIPTHSGAFDPSDVYADWAKMFNDAQDAYAKLQRLQDDGQIPDTHRLLGFVRVYRIPLKVGGKVETLAIDPGSGMPVSGIVREIDEVVADTETK